MSHAAALQIVRTLTAAGQVAYFAGGCVRDMLLGHDPADFDVATDAPPGRVRELFRNTQAVGEHFGVILVRIDGEQVEVATFRTDGDYHDGRRPVGVTFSDAEHDARRRDFTINGLFFDPVAEQVIDHVGGRADLDAGLIRAIGDPVERFAEDHLRLIRGVRFASRFAFEIEPATLAATRELAPKLARVSTERVGHEMRKTFARDHTAAGARLLASTALLPVLFRGLPEPVLASDATYHAVRRDGDGPVEIALGLAAIVRDIYGDPPDAAARVLRRNLSLSNAETSALNNCLDALALLGQTVPIARQKRLLAGEHGHTVARFLRAVSDEDWVHNLETHTDPAPPPMVTGEDLLNLGASPGPAFKRVLDTVYDAQLEDRVENREAAMSLAAMLLSPEAKG